jgi:hypothetical protein
MPLGRTTPTLRGEKFFAAPMGLTLIGSGKRVKQKWPSLNGRKSAVDWIKSRYAEFIAAFKRHFSF